MVWNNLTVGSHALHNVMTDYVNISNSITTVVEPTPTANIVTKEYILTQYSIKQVS